MVNIMESSKVIGIQFSMMSPDEIRKNSVVEVTSRNTYMNNKPDIGGLFDPRMGVLEPGYICPTDGYNYIDCPGYFGHIELAKPVFFIQHIKEIIKISKCICLKCSKLLISKERHKHILNYSESDRWQYVYNTINKANIRHCGDANEEGCGCKIPDVKMPTNSFATIIADWKEKNDNTDGSDFTIKLTPEIIVKIFRRISDDDIHFMGFSPIWSRPEWFVCQVLPIAPPSMRPSVKHDAQQRSEDDLTHIYSNIIKANNDLRDKLASGDTNSNVIEGLITNLQYFVAMIANNKVKGSAPMQQRSGRPLQCIMDRLNSKFGRIRGNLMGKRVDFSARSVITGDPNLSIRQLGVPMKVAMNITKPVTVNERNINFLTKLIQNGPDVYPGAKILEKKNGENISLRYMDRNSIRLEHGDVVHRHMMDGDGVLFNRQPSLHRMSMMCHIVKVMKKGDTFRMNVADTAPYNADFDGDEMNMHMPQNILAETELKQLAAIPYQIVSPAKNAPIIGIFQDSMLGSYRFTRPNISFNPRQAMNLLMMFKHVDTKKLFEKGNKINNFDILSQILKPITLKNKTKLFDNDEDPQTSNNILEIVNGVYKRGQLEKSMLGSSTKGIIHRIFNDYGHKQAAQFIDDLQNVITEYMTSSSYSVGISDLIADRKTQDSITQAITSQKQQVYSLIDKLHLGIFDNTSANSNLVEFETQVNNILNKATEQAGKIGRKSLDKNNRFLMIVESGAKGSLINISQMISCLGQTNVEGKRIPYGYDDRSLPHFNKFDDSPLARGFIENSYISGLTAQELFFHAMGGRIGLIDTAVKTSQTGYIQRRLIKGLEDLKTEYDMTIRDNKHKIVQFYYGDDGFDSTKVENQFIPLVEMTTNDIYMLYDIIGIHDERKGMSQIYTKGTITRMKKQRDDTKKLCKKYIDYFIDMRKSIVENVFKRKNESGVKSPISFSNIVNNIQQQLNLNGNSTIDITPLEAFELIQHYYDKMTSLNYLPENNLLKVLYFYHLSPKNLLIMKRFHRKGLIMLLETVTMKFKESWVHPGEMVGVIAGQSIGEPTTQLTLNTFHLAGVASKSNVTRGVPRIEEILRLTKNPKGPSLTVFLNEYEQEDQKKASNYSNMLNHTKLGDIVKNVQICFDANDNTSIIEGDSNLIQQYYEFEKLVSDCNENEDSDNQFEKSKWIIRIEMSSEKMLEHNISMDDVHFVISSVHGDDIHCIYSDYNMNDLIFRIRVNSSILSSNAHRGKDRKKESGPAILDQSDEIYLLHEFQENLLNNIVLRGIQNITNVSIRKVQNYMVENENGYESKDIWVLDSAGSNLLDILGVDFIDSNRTVSNDIKEVFNVLGLEAARQVIHDEFVDVMEFSGVYINYHHLGLLCDRMTLTKNMVSIFRSGILGDDIGPISKSTFEVHTEVLLNASRHAEFDHMRGVSANVMLGQTGPYGTGMCNLVLDMNAISQMDDEDIVEDTRKQDIENAFNIKQQRTCENTVIQNTISSIQVNEDDCCDDNDGYDLDF